MDKKIIIIIFLISIALFIIFSLTNLVLLYIEEKKEQYGDGYFRDVYQNLYTAPIKSIKIATDKKNCYNLFTEKYKIYKWKGICFQIERIYSIYHNLIDKETDSFQIGTDSLGNKLYSTKKVINYIEITNSPKSSLDNLYPITTLQIDSKTYLHYSTDYINGTVLVDLKLGTEQKPCDNMDKMKSFDISKYSCKDKDKDLGNTYKKLDETIIKDYNNKAKNPNQKIYLYKRTYIGTPKDFINIHDLDGIKDFAKKKIKKMRIVYYLLYVFNPFELGLFESMGMIIFSAIVFFIIGLLLPIYIIKLCVKCIKNYNLYRVHIFSMMNHGIKYYYNSNIWFMIIDKTILAFEIILTLPYILIVIYLLILGLKQLGILGKKVINKISKKLKEKEERKKRIKQYKDEIKELEKNPDIPLSKINEKRLLFFKEKFLDALTCPISLDIFTDPVIVNSGHTYERSYIMKIAENNGKDPLTRETIKKDSLIGNYLVKKLIIEFNSGIEFNENIYNKMVELLKCPLSHKFFKNPCLAPIGNQGMTYEKAFIEEYIFNKKNDPTFDETIKGNLIKNFVIKDMVDAFIEMNEHHKDYSIDMGNKEKLERSLILNEKVINDNDNKGSESKKIANYFDIKSEENEARNHNGDIQTIEDHNINNDIISIDNEN